MAILGLFFNTLPTRIDMGQRVLETLNATVQVRLKTLEGTLVF
jgi:tocopherol cyclase